MISSRIKNNIYALISLSIIISTIASFVLITSFLVNMNDLVFNINENNTNGNGAILDMSGYDKAKDILNSVDNN